MNSTNNSTSLDLQWAIDLTEIINNYVIRITDGVGALANLLFVVLLLNKNLKQKALIVNRYLQIIRKQNFFSKMSKTLSLFICFSLPILICVPFYFIYDIVLLFGYFPTLFPISNNFANV